jgi:hypothetical protein
MNRMKRSLAQYFVEHLFRVLSALKRNSRSNARAERQSLLENVSYLALVNAMVREEMWHIGWRSGFHRICANLTGVRNGRSTIRQSYSGEAASMSGLYIGIIANVFTFRYY